MLYLITQMWICLLAAFLLGLILCWLCSRKCKCKDCCGKKNLNNENSGVAPLMSSTKSSAKVDVTDLDTLVDLGGEDFAIETLEGIGPRTGQLFRGVGIATVGDLLRKAHSQSLRDDLANKLEIKVEPLNDWAGMSDLLRIKGMDHQASELAYATGAYNVETLANWDATNFVDAMNTKNNAGPQLIAPTVANAEQVSDWISQAKNMKAVVTF